MYVGTLKTVAFSLWFDLLFVRKMVFMSHRLKVFWKTPSKVKTFQKLHLTVTVCTGTWVISVNQLYCHSTHDSPSHRAVVIILLLLLLSYLAT